MRPVVVIATVFLYIQFAVATQVDKCQQGPGVQEADITNCDKPPCRLKKKTEVQAVFKFTPEKDVSELTNTVYAEIVGIPFPFLGVDGTKACDQIYEADEKTKASCPLKAGQQYIYKNKFPILDVYPKIKVVVHWALTGPDGQDYMCLEVPARITS